MEEGTFSSRCYIIKILTGGIMKEYTPKQIKQLKANPYTLNVTKYKLYFTAKFKEDFWISYQAGNAPRKIMTDLGYDLSMFTQKQIDNYVQRIKKEALSGNGFTEGENTRYIRIRFDANAEGNKLKVSNIKVMPDGVSYIAPKTYTKGQLLGTSLSVPLHAVRW